MNLIKSLLTVFLSTLIALILFELIFRSYFLANKSLYLDSSTNKKPQHFLVENWNSHDLLILNGKRVHKHLIDDENNKKKYRVALIGDSIAFGSSLATKDTLAYLLDKKDGEIEIINHGVPGYNVFDYNHIIKNFKKDEYDLIIYLLTKNDITLASTGQYSLLRSDDEVIVRYNEIDQSLMSKTKVFLQRNLKSLYVIASNIINRKYSNLPVYNASTYTEETPTRCIKDIENQYNKQKKVESFLNNAYSNELYTKKMTEIILETKEYIENYLNSNIVLVPVWNFHEVNNFSQSPFKNFVINLRNQGIHTPEILFDINIHKYSRECGYWADPGHPGRKYNQGFSENLYPEIKLMLHSK